jgi:hypothetical protein
MHDDAGAVDGFFAGKLEPGLPPSAEVQFYLEAVDLSGETLLLPDAAELVGAGTEPVAWSFSLRPPPALEIAEVSSSNASLVRDETGGSPDFVKVRNTGAASITLTGVMLARSPLRAARRCSAFPTA